MKKEKLVILSGAGMSAESGISVFRGSDGLWEGYSIMEVATMEGWLKQPGVVLEFYNQRRKQVMEAKPNTGHQIIAALEMDFDVSVITQNVDDLHERAGSSNVLHLHGELMKARSTVNENNLKQLNSWELNIGDLCSEGGQLRPHVVWFGEPVPMIEPAIDIVSTADILVIVGTSMSVYPAASLVHFCPDKALLFCIDPNMPDLPHRKPPVVAIAKGAGQGMTELREILLNRN